MNCFFTVGEELKKLNHYQLRWCFHTDLCDTAVIMEAVGANCSLSESIIRIWTLKIAEGTCCGLGSKWQVIFHTADVSQLSLKTAGYKPKGDNV